MKRGLSRSGSGSTRSAGRRAARPRRSGRDRAWRRSVGRAGLAERRVHRPLDRGDLDLDPGDQGDRGDVLRAAVRCLVAAPPRLAMERQELVACPRQLAAGPLAVSWWAMGTSDRNEAERTRSGRLGLDDGEQLPACTCSAARTRRSAMRPAIEATTTCSIFMASSVTTGSPAATTAADRGVDRRTAPGIGARSSTGRWRRAGRGRPRRGPPRRRPAVAPARNAVLRPATSRWTVSPTRTDSYPGCRERRQRSTATDRTARRR